MNNDYTIQVHGQLYRIESSSIVAGLRGATVRIEKRLDGTLHARFRDRYLSIQAVEHFQKPVPMQKTPRPRTGKRATTSEAMRASMRSLLKQPGPPLWKSLQDRTRISDQLD